VLFAAGPAALLREFFGFFFCILIFFLLRLEFYFLFFSLEIELVVDFLVLFVLGIYFYFQVST
jgi:hypothetical protein